MSNKSNFRLSQAARPVSVGSASSRTMSIISKIANYLNPLNYIPKKRSSLFGGSTETKGMRLSAPGPSKSAAPRSAKGKAKSEQLANMTFATSPDKSPAAIRRDVLSGTGDRTLSKRSTQSKLTEGSSKSEKAVSLGELDFASDNPRYQKRLEKEYRALRLAAGDSPEKIDADLKTVKRKKPKRSPIPPGF